MAFCFHRHAVCALAALVLVAGCSGPESSVAPLTDTTVTQHSRTLLAAIARQTGTGYKVIHSFNGQNGAQPWSLLPVNGTLYGITDNGGAYNGGTAFSLSPTGAEKVLHSFGAGEDGAAPTDSLMLFNGTFYGVTSKGGTHAVGTVFSLTTSGKERVLYSFGGGSDGEYPSGALVEHAGKLYGATGYGGTGCSPYPGCGTVFSITPSGSETVLYRFQGGDDGEFPGAPLLELGGSMYGVASEGGKNLSGTFYRISDIGKLTVLYSFGPGSSPDAQDPNGGPIASHGSVYGTASSGGPYGDGAVYAITTGGLEHVVSTFDIKNGQSPSAALVALDGKLYGTTFLGGGHGAGIVFQLTPAGKMHVLHAFTGYGDGGNPQAALTVFHGVLYGTTLYGGAHNDGVVFTVTP